ncbi:hypothetical protein FGM00_14135 [Aggregatimonas sangjinii]|uniref:Uncharacterized protein n=1 Tax=Aggregatimonas sangjinii TaxID=2583587 RepID=A0A5B7SWU6_9FLAO|nr:hypothetical protein [Aggregatimonas sangjinii]QCX01194.1 hypothetical protein FGM00_14135 [Aggregatimonas sangjinii]
MKKTLVLVVLFVLPIVVYLFFLSGTTNFGKLAVLTENIGEIPSSDDDITLNEKITVLGFLGSDINVKRTNALNLNQKIYKRFYEFNDFQFIMVVPEGTESDVAELQKELGALADTKKWHFVFMDKTKIQTFFDGLKTDVTLDENMATPLVFIIDKDRSLRGRNDDEDEQTKYGFNSSSIADLNNKMVDDVKIILAEYRLALKKNKTRREI